MTKSILSTWFFLYLLFSSSIGSAQVGPIVSPIGPQSVLVGGHINIFFSGVGPEIIFASDDLPSFAQIREDGDNSGVISINTTTGDEGTYIFHLNAKGVSGTNVKTIKLEVKPIPEGATVYYSDPVNGSMSNNGDSINPWASLEAIFASFKTFNPGDVIFCRDGLHGRVGISGRNDDYVTIVAQSGHSPKLQNIFINTAENWIISGLDISPEHAGITLKTNYVNIMTSAKNILIENCKISSIDDANIWTTNQDWYDNVGNGIVNQGKACLIRNNFIKNTFFSVSIENVNNRLEYNTIDRFGGDAIRAIADDVSIGFNVIKNAIVDDYSDPGGNHDDAFQSWTFGNPRTNITISGNQIFSFTDPNIPLLSSVMQGIVDFDGFEENWVIENNLIVQDHPHGIALFGAKNCKVVNNTVIRHPLRMFDFGSDPWVNISPHKDTRRSTGNLVRNNLMGAIVFDDNPGTRDYNRVSTNYDQFLVDYKNWDFHLKDGSALIDAGIKADAPTIDNNGFVRQPDNRVDFGCFESSTDIRDFESPSAPTNLTVDNATNSTLEFSWSIPTDNIGISFYEVTIDDNITHVVKPVFIARGLEAEKEYNIEIIALDFSGNRSDALTSLESTIAANEMDFEIEVPIHQKDHQIKSNSRLQWVGLEEHQIGGAYSGLDGSAVYPFRIPEVESSMDITKINFHIELLGIEDIPTGQVDIFALSSERNPDVKSNMHWQGSFEDGSAIGTTIMDDFVTFSRESGRITLDNDAALKLAVFVTDQLNNGAEAGDYIFLRLNIDITNEQNGAYYRFSSADTDDVALQPYVTFTIGDLSTPTNDVEIGKQVLEAYPNPISINQNLTLHLNGGDSQQLSINDINGKEIWSQTFDKGLKNGIEIMTSSIIKNAGMYFLTLKDGRTVSTRKLIVF